MKRNKTTGTSSLCEKMHLHRLLEQLLFYLSLIVAIASLPEAILTISRYIFYLYELLYYFL
ncbi:MAG: hypothetical protein E7263_06065 [Lachnospiraceae bacterium]|nr:hypothetical protein [Lachnospiraceae bacterium]